MCTSTWAEDNDQQSQTLTCNRHFTRMSWECHTSKRVPKHALKYGIFWTSSRNQKLGLICGTLH